MIPRRHGRIQGVERIELLDGVLDYWIVNLIGHVVEVYRDPAPLELPQRGWGYRSARKFRPGMVLAPLAAPDARIAVEDLMP